MVKTAWGLGRICLAARAPTCRPWNVPRVVDRRIEDRGVPSRRTERVRMESPTTAVVLLVP